MGASTHPGTGVPICLAGSKITSEQVLEAEGMDVPWKVVKKKKKKSGEEGEGVAVVKEIDRLRIRPVLSNFHIGIGALVLMFLVLCFRVYRN